MTILKFDIQTFNWIEIKQIEKYHDIFVSFGPTRNIISNSTFTSASF